MDALKVNPKIFELLDIKLKKDEEVLAVMDEIKNPLWNKIVNPLSILLVFLFGYWWVDSRRK
jgi:hypothetical protein